MLKCLRKKGKDLNKNLQIKRVKKSSIPLIGLGSVGYSKPINKRGVFKNRFIPSIGVSSIFNRMQKRKISKNSRVLFHTEVKKIQISKQDVLFIKKIMYVLDIPLLYYEKIFFENQHIKKTVTDWNFIKSLLAKTFRCAFDQRTFIVQSLQKHALFKSQMSDLKKWTNLLEHY